MAKCVLIHTLTLTHTHVQHGEQQLLTARRVLPQRAQQRGMRGAQGGGERPGVATNGSLTWVRERERMVGNSTGR